MDTLSDQQIWGRDPLLRLDDDPAKHITNEPVRPPPLIDAVYNRIWPENEDFNDLFIFEE